MTQLHELTMIEQDAAIRAREISPVELVDHYLDRIERLNDTVGAFVHVAPDQARAAAKDAESAVNEANTYRNRVINEAKGDAAKIVQSAQAYREQSVREAVGQAARFDQVYAEYRRAPAVTRERLYLETMERVLNRSNKVIVGAKGATAPIVLPPDALRRPAAPADSQVPPQAQGEAPQAHPARPAQ